MDGSLFIFYDTETTGLSTATDEIVELGARVDLDGVHVPDATSESPRECFGALVRPARRAVPVAASNVHGLTMVQLVHAETFASVASEFYAWIESWLVRTARSRAILVAHNNFRYDMQILSRQTSECGYTVAAHIVFADTLPLLRELMPKPGRSFALLRLWKEWIATPAQPEPTGAAHRVASDVDMLISVARHACVFTHGTFMQRLHEHACAAP